MFSFLQLQNGWRVFRKLYLSFSLGKYFSPSHSLVGGFSYRVKVSKSPVSIASYNFKIFDLEMVTARVFNVEILLNLSNYW